MFDDFFHVGFVGIKEIMNVVVVVVVVIILNSYFFFCFFTWVLWESAIGSGSNMMYGTVCGIS